MTAFATSFSEEDRHLPEAALLAGLTGANPLPFGEDLPEEATCPCMQV